MAGLRSQGRKGNYHFHAHLSLSDLTDQTLALLAECIEVVDRKEGATHTVQGQAGDMNYFYAGMVISLHAVIIAAASNVACDMLVYVLCIVPSGEIVVVP